MHGKIALITGGNSWIGRAAAELFAKKGAAVVIAGRRATEGQDTITAIHAVGGEATFIQADVTAAAEVHRLVEATVQAYGRLDYAFNNAGVIGPRVPTADCAEEDWHAVIAVNLTGVWLCMKHEILQMLKNGGGVIVNMASILGLSVNSRYGPAYAASEHGVVGLTKLAAVQYAPHNIGINAVCPGIICIPMTAQIFEGCGTGSPDYSLASAGACRRIRGGRGSGSVVVFRECLVHHRPRFTSRWWSYREVLAK